MHHTRFTFIFFFIICFLSILCACNDSGSSHIGIPDEKPSELVGTWQQTAIGSEKVSGIVVEITFNESTMTMDAPGCLIIGDYITDGDILTYTVTSAQGERCAAEQAGKKDRVKFSVHEDRLLMAPLFAGKDKQSTYERVDQPTQSKN